MSHTPQDVFFRWVLAPGADLDALRAQLGELGDELLAGGRRSADGRCVDVDLHWEFRSQRPLIGAEEALFQGSPAVEAIWLRVRTGFSGSGLADDDQDVDGIGQVDVEFDRLGWNLWRPCRYGFDEIRVAGASVPVPGFVVEGDAQIRRGAGSYLARDCSAGLLAHYDIAGGAELARVEPIDVLPIVRPGGFARIEWRCSGRVVHAAASSAEGLVEHETDDGWDNCVDDVYLERFGDPTRRRPAHVYAGDRSPAAELDD